MNAIFVMWIMSSVVGSLVLLRVLLRPPVNAAVAEAVRWSGFAAVPGLSTLVEYAAFECGGFASARYLTRWPFLFGSMFGVVVLVASFIDMPPRALDTKWELARLSHVIAWGCGAVLAMAMLLDV